MITWLAENSDDEHLKKVKQNAEQHAVKMEVASRSVHDEKALFDEDDGEDEIVLGRDVRGKDDEANSKQRQLSKSRVAPRFDGLRSTPSGHKIQEIKELQTVPVRTCLSANPLDNSSCRAQVIVTADLTKSPPVIKVYSVNPYAEKTEQK